MVNTPPVALSLPLPARPDGAPSASRGNLPFAAPSSETQGDSFRASAPPKVRFAGRNSSPPPQAHGRTVGSLVKTLIRWPLGMATAAGGMVLGPLALVQFGLGFFFHPLWLTGALTIAPVALAGYATMKLR